MKDLFVPYELAVKLKEKGFKEKCIFMYDKLNMLSKDLRTNEQEFYGVNYNSSLYCCSAPFWQQVIDWLREEKNIKVVENPNGGWEVYCEYDGRYILDSSHNELIKGIEKALELI